MGISNTGGNVGVSGAQQQQPSVAGPAPSIGPLQDLKPEEANRQPVAGPSTVPLAAGPAVPSLAEKIRAREQEAARAALHDMLSNRDVDGAGKSIRELVGVIHEGGASAGEAANALRSADVANLEAAVYATGPDQASKNRAHHAIHSLGYLAAEGNEGAARVLRDIAQGPDNFRAKDVVDHLGVLFKRNGKPSALRLLSDLASAGNTVARNKVLELASPSLAEQPLMDVVFTLRRLANRNNAEAIDKLLELAQPGLPEKVLDLIAFGLQAVRIGAEDQGTKDLTYAALRRLAAAGNHEAAEFINRI